ncbi:unnamed protein product [Timema podura]|uniref:Acyltransferase 3 domain-containing protein n=1 Tax=Timema podura TaxID=61482 RepID=A0ABN7NQV8_TIMPD|nr:unnamed protein product [Timema podura]
MWNKVVKRNADLCKVSMWRNMLYVQNFYSFEEMEDRKCIHISMEGEWKNILEKPTISARDKVSNLDIPVIGSLVYCESSTLDLADTECATHTHQLALDMQLSLVAPLLVYLLFISQGWGILLLATLHLISVALRYYVSVQNNLSMLIYHRMTLNQLYDTANMSYSLPTHRATPYMFGVCLGYLLHKTDRKIYIPKYLVFGGWLSASYLTYLSFFSTSEVASPEYLYEAVETSLYSALSPVIWSLALCWVILACATGYGGWLNSALCWRGLTTFSKISYSVYLTQFAVFFYNVGTTRTSQEFNAFTSAVRLRERVRRIGQFSECAEIPPIHEIGKFTNGV